MADNPKSLASDCEGCRAQKREWWRSFLYGFTFGAIDFRLSMDEYWERHQQALGEPNLLGKWGY